jgi:hypothetical protein
MFTRECMIAAFGTSGLQRWNPSKYVGISLGVDITTSISVESNCRNTQDMYLLLVQGDAATFTADFHGNAVHFYFLLETALSLQIKLLLCTLCSI